jgi:hypothetical protein
MSDFFKFVEDLKDTSNFSSQLSKDGITKKDLQVWFNNQGYDVSLQECQEILNKKEYIKGGIDSVKGY